MVTKYAQDFKAIRHPILFIKFWPYLLYLPKVKTSHTRKRRWIINFFFEQVGEQI